jgi:phosphoribosylanthranilate isomerase
VFVNAPVDVVAKIAAATNLDAIQFHGDEPPEYLAAIRAAGDWPIIRAFRCRNNNYQQMATYMSPASAGSSDERPPYSALIDAFVEGAYGGGGQTINWQEFRAARPLFRLPLILAGGLNATNVAIAIDQARPDAVDVASGVESSPGKKDPELIQRFVENAKRAFERLESTS